jgi:hypothetical protein
MGNFQDLSGQEFNDLKVISLYGMNKHGRAVWVCECKCGLIKNITANELKSGRKSCSNSCSSWKGYGEISSCYWHNTKTNAAKRNIEFNLDIKYAWELYLEQDRKCKLTGLEISLSRNRFINQTASLDRIDSNKGYTTDNIQWVHKYVQKIKLDLPNETFKKICLLVVKNNKDLLDSIESPIIIDESFKQIKRRKDNKRLPVTEVLNIKQMYKDGYSISKLSEIFNRSHTQISRIINGKSWKEIKITESIPSEYNK